MKRMLLLIGFILIISIAVLGEAKVIYHNDSIRTAYGAGDIVTGTLNVTLNKTNFDSIIRTNFAGTNMSFRDFFIANGFELVEDYNCSTSNCLAGYVRKEEVSSFSLSNGRALIGFSVQGTVTSVDEVQALFQSTASSSCYLNLALDVLNRSEYFLGSGRYIDESCYEPRYGCFERALAGSETLTMNSGQDYCERITLPVAPAFRAGVNVTAATQGQAGLKMSIHALDSTPVGECTLPAITETSQVVECIIPFAHALQQDYFVCVSPTGAGSNHRIRYETNNPCGTPDFGASYPGDYEIFAKNLKFDTPRIDLTESGFENATGADLTEYVAAYLSDYYGSACSPYCIVPLLFSGSDQTIDVTSPRFRYTSSLGGQLNNDRLYRVERGNVTIDAKRIVLDISKANFTIPAGASGNRLKIYIDGEEVVNKPINLSASFSFGLTPSFATFGQLTTFNVVTNFNVSSVRWTFGDGSAPQTSTGKTIGYRYLRQGTFNLEAEVTRSDGVVSRRTLVVTIGNARDAATSMIMSSRQRMAAISTNITNYPVWAREPLKTQLDFTTLNATLREAELLFARAANDSDYALVVNTLIALDIPRSIQTEVRGTVPLISGLENADIGTLRTLMGREQGTDEEVRAALASWTLENSHAEIGFDSVVAYHDEDVRPVLTLFKIQTKPATSFEDDTYLIINVNPNDITFASTYASEPLGGSATSIRLGHANEIIEFAILDSLHPDELGSYITPPFDSLGVFDEPTSYDCNYNAECDSGETWKTCPNDCRPWGLASVIIIILVFAGAITLGAILWWYKTRYETSLFAHRQDLINVLQFIKTSTRAGMEEHEIKKKLKHAGWTSEQIGYAFSKHRKSRGAPHEDMNDVRFIKRPDFKAP